MAGAARPTIGAQVRAKQRKSELGTLRRMGSIPGSLYGGTLGPVSLHVPGRSIRAHLEAHGSGALLDLEMDGQVTTAVLREIERDAVTGAIIHAAFQRIGSGDQLHAAIPLRFEGVEELIREGRVLQTLVDTIELRGQADLLPELLVFDVTGRLAGDVIHIGDIPLPAGVELMRGAATAAAIVSQPRTTAPVAEAE